MDGGRVALVLGGGWRSQAAAGSLCLFAVLLLTLIGLIGVPGAAAPAAPTAPATPALPDGGTPLVRDTSAAALVQAARWNAGLQAKVVEVGGQPFAEAAQLTTLRPTDPPWGAQIGLATNAPIQKGDTLWVEFSVRATAASEDEAALEFIFERNGDPWEKSGDAMVHVPAGGDWQTFQVPFTSADTYPAGAAHFTLRLGYEAQTVQVAGFRLLDFGPNVAPGSLPRNHLWYAGHDPAAPWRSAAAERIDQYRKADLRIAVRDANGAPVSGAQIHVQMTRHAFPFGTAINAGVLDDPSNTRYRQAVADLFNVAVIENGLKWPFWETWGHDPAVAALDWLDDHHIPVRGHNLVWPGWGNLPGWLKSLQDDPAALERAVEQHIASEAGELKGRLIGWDVVNEPYTNHDLQDILGPDILTKWFDAAHAADPNAQLFLNDYSILSAGGTDLTHQKAYEAQIRSLLAVGAPLDAIGMQGHFDSNLTPPAKLASVIEHFATLGLPIWITEFDLSLNDPSVEADYLRDFYTLAFSEPSVHGILMWGFWDGAHWHHSAPLYNQDWSLKPSGQAFIDLVFHKWWTDATLTSGADGTAAMRGFKGDYTITVAAGGREVKQAVTLGDGGSQVTVEVG